MLNKEPSGSEFARSDILTSLIVRISWSGVSRVCSPRNVKLLTCVGSMKSYTRAFLKSGMYVILTKCYQDTNYVRAVAVQVTFQV